MVAAQASAGFLNGLFFGHGGGEVQQLQVALGLDGVQEQVQTGTALLVDQQLVNSLEELTLCSLQLLASLLQTTGLDGDGIDGSVQLVQGIAALGQVGMEISDLLLFQIGQLVVDIADRRKAPWAGAWPGGSGPPFPEPPSPGAAARPSSPSGK